MTKTMMVLAAALMVGAMAHAADMENKGEATTDTSKNPITGTVTTTMRVRKEEGEEFPLFFEPTRITTIPF